MLVHAASTFLVVVYHMQLYCLLLVFNHLSAFSLLFPFCPVCSPFPLYSHPSSSTTVSPLLSLTLLQLKSTHTTITCIWPNPYTSIQPETCRSSRCCSLWIRRALRISDESPHCQRGTRRSLLPRPPSHPPRSPSPPPQVTQPRGADPWVHYQTWPRGFLAVGLQVEGRDQCFSSDRLLLCVWARGSHPVNPNINKHIVYNRLWFVLIDLLYFLCLIFVQPFMLCLIVIAGVWGCDLVDKDTGVTGSGQRSTITPRLPSFIFLIFFYTV